MKKGKSDANKYDFKTVLCFSYHFFFFCRMKKKTHKFLRLIPCLFIFSSSIRTLYISLIIQLPRCQRKECIAKKGKNPYNKYVFWFYIHFITLVPCDKIKSRCFVHTFKMFCIALTSTILDHVYKWFGI